MNVLSIQSRSVLWILCSLHQQTVLASLLVLPAVSVPASCEGASRWFLSLWTGPSSVERIHQCRRPRPGRPGGVVSLSPLSPVYPAPFGVRRSGGWASKGRARHPPLPRPRHRGRILTRAGFLNGPTIWKGISGDGLSSAMACFHITGKFYRRTVQDSLKIGASWAHGDSYFCQRISTAGCLSWLAAG